MQTREQIFRAELDLLPEVEYPKDVVERWDAELEVARAQIAAGELKPQTVEELAAELGIDLD